MSNISAILARLNQNRVEESKSETFSVSRIVSVGDTSHDKMELGTVTGSLREIKKEVAKKYGPIVDIDVKKREIIVEASRLELINQNKARYKYVQDNADKLVKDKIDNAITKSLILRWIKGRNWEGGLGNGKDIDKMLDKLSSEYGLDAMVVADKLDELIEFWEKQFKSEGL